MNETLAETNQRWDRVYSEQFMTNWYPNEDIIRFCARLIQKKLTHDRFRLRSESIASWIWVAAMVVMQFTLLARAFEHRG
jgi:hypothetical protein